MDQPTSTPAPADFDFDAFEDVSTAVLRIKTPDGLPTAMSITLAGPEHPERKKRGFVRQRKFRQEFAKLGKMPVSDPADDYDDETDELVANTLGWEGARVPYSAQAARALYVDPKRQWLRAQVAAALNERDRFTRSSAAS